MIDNRNHTAGYNLHCWVVLLLVGTVAGSLAGCATTNRHLSASERALNAESFDHVWKTIRDRHFDPTLGGLDWEAVRDELRPQAASADTMAGARSAMREMIKRLDLSHFGIIPARAYEALDPETEPGSRIGVPGFDLRVFDDKALVTRVRADTSASELGVRPGWQIARIDEHEVEPIITRVHEHYADSTQMELRLQRALFGRMRRAIGGSVEVEFIDGSGDTATGSIINIEPPGIASTFGNMPTQYVEVETRMVGGDIVYFYMSSWFSPVTVMPALRKAITEHLDAAGFVLDLRGNPGGIAGLAMGVAGLFEEQAGRDLGTMKMRESDLRFVVNPQPTRFPGPMAILIDGASGSTSEIFAAGMKDLDRARLFGRRTAGVALPSTLHRLPNGDGFQFAHADYVRYDGRRIEGIGVAPHLEITPTREQLLANQDPVLEAAVSWIHSQSATISKTNVLTD